MTDQSAPKLLPETAESQRAPGQTFPPEELQAVLAGARYGIPDLETLRGVLGDAFALYDVAHGDGRLTAILSAIEQRADPEVFALLILDLARWLRPRLQRAVDEILGLQLQNERLRIPRGPLQ